MKPGKPGRKKKRKYAGPNSQLKKKQQRLGYDDAEKSDSSTSLNNISLPGIRGPLDLSGYVATTNQVEANSGSVGMLRQVSLAEVEKEYDPTRNELRGPGIGSEGDNVRANGFLKVYPKEFDKDSRFIGAKRRKSGSVRRFKQDGTASNNNNNHTKATTPDQNQTPELTTLDSFGKTARIGNVLENNSISQKSKVEELDIVRIIKPARFSSSITNNVQDALVTFSALRFVCLFTLWSVLTFEFILIWLLTTTHRSDGKEVTVDNRFLKAHNPLLVGFIFRVFSSALYSNGRV